MSAMSDRRTCSYTYVSDIADECTAKKTVLSAIADSHSERVKEGIPESLCLLRKIPCYPQNKILLIIGRRLVLFLRINFFSDLFI